MVADERVRGIALFFLFSLMDEKAANEASQKVVAHLKASGVRPTEKLSTDTELIRILKKGFEHGRKPASRGRAVSVSEETVHSGVDLTVWTKFQKESGDGELLAVVLSRILGFSDETIAEGLGISSGTVRYRIGKGMRALGLIAQQNPETKKA